MDIFLIISIVSTAIGIIYFGWKLVKYIVYSLSHSVAKGIYDAKNPVKVPSKPKIILSTADRRIRNDWVRALFVYILGNLALCLGSYLFMASQTTADFAKDYLLEGFEDLSVISLSATLIFFFAYVKFGTKWIGLFVYLSPLRTLIETSKSLFQTLALPDITTDFITYLLILTFFAASFYLYFWIHCLRLYQLNWDIKKRKAAQINEAIPSSAV